MAFSNWHKKNILGGKIGFWKKNWLFPLGFVAPHSSLPWQPGCPQDQGCSYRDGAVANHAHLQRAVLTRLPALRALLQRAEESVSEGSTLKCGQPLRFWPGSRHQTSSNRAKPEYCEEQHRALRPAHSPNGTDLKKILR